MASDGGHHRYELVERIAVGGMAEVFLAKTYGSHGFEKVLAIKRILPDFASAPEFERRFIAEAKIAVTLNHANIVQVLDFSRFGDSLYIAMEYVDGLDAAALLEACPELPIGAALYLAMEMLKGLDFAHRRGVVHRDVSPSNVLVSRAGEVKIADFGIAQATNAGIGVTRTRRIMGKWRYMSPEQTRGDTLDERSDLFSAGVVMFEILTGQKLFRGNDAETIVRNITGMDIPRVAKVRPSLPAALNQVLAGLLARDREKRAASAADVLGKLVDISYERSVQATAMSLADVVTQVMPDPRREDPLAAASARLIDDIIDSEIKSGDRPARTRVTVDDARMPDFAPEDVESLTFVGSGTTVNGITEWVVEPTVVKPVPKGKTLPLGLAGGVFELTTPPRQDAGSPEEKLVDRAPPGSRAAREAKEAADLSYVGPRSRSWLGLAVLGLAVATVGGVLIARLLRGESARPATAAVSDAGGATATADAAIPAAVAVAIDSVPRGAAIWIGGRDTHEATPGTVELSEPGTEIEMRLDGYQLCKAAWDGSAAASCELSALGASLTVTTRPPGATVLLDGKKLGTTPIEGLDVPVDPARAILEIRLDGYKTQTRKVTLVAGEDIDVNARLAEKQKLGTIDIYAEPWAHVYLRGKKVGTAPQRGLELPVGRHRLKLENPVQKRSTTITVTVPSDKPYRVLMPK